MTSKVIFALKEEAIHNIGIQMIIKKKKRSLWLIQTYFSVVRVIMVIEGEIVYARIGVTRMQKVIMRGYRGRGNVQSFPGNNSGYRGGGDVL